MCLLMDDLKCHYIPLVHHRVLLLFTFSVSPSQYNFTLSIHRSLHNLYKKVFSETFKNKIISYMFMKDFCYNYGSGCVDLMGSVYTE